MNAPRNIRNPHVVRALAGEFFDYPQRQRPQAAFRQPRPVRAAVRRDGSGQRRPFPSLAHRGADDHPGRSGGRAFLSRVERMNAQLKEQPRIGIFADEPAEAYYVRRLDVASASGLSVLDNDDDGCPARYFHWVHNPDTEEESSALAFGKAYHMATLEPERFRDVYSVLPADAPKDLRRFRDAKKPGADTLASIAWWDEWEANNAGRIMLTRQNYDLAVAMAESLRRLPLEFGAIRITLAELIDECETEVTVYWVDEETGIQCKLRADLWSRELRFAGDLKSARYASRSAFGRAIHAHRYHVQHAHYCEGFRAAGEPLASFGLLPCEKTAPYVAASWHVDAPSEERGWALRQRAMHRLAACLKSGHWPGYTTTMTPIGIPAFGHYDVEG